METERNNLEVLSLRVKAGLVLSLASLAADYAVADAGIDLLRELPEEGPGVPARMVRAAERSNLGNAEQRLVTYIEAFLPAATGEAVAIAQSASDMRARAEAFGRRYRRHRQFDN